jgi:hypothetical protein
MGQFVAAVLGSTEVQSKEIFRRRGEGLPDTDPGHVLGRHALGMRRKPLSVPCQALELLLGLTVVRRSEKQDLCPIPDTTIGSDLTQVIDPTFMCPYYSCPSSRLVRRARPRRLRYSPVTSRVSRILPRQVRLWCESDYVCGKRRPFQ